MTQGFRELHRLLQPISISFTITFNPLKKKSQISSIAMGTGICQYSQPTLLHTQDLSFVFLWREDKGKEKSLECYLQKVPFSSLEKASPLTQLLP